MVTSGKQGFRNTRNDVNELEHSCCCEGEATDSQSGLPEAMFRFAFGVTRKGDAQKSNSADLASFPGPEAGSEVQLYIEGCARWLNDS